MYGLRRFKIPLDEFPLCRMIEENCMKLPAFQKAAPESSPMHPPTWNQFTDRNFTPLNQERTIAMSDHAAPVIDENDPDYTPYVIDQGWDKYSAEEHETWKILYDRQQKILPGRACDEFMQNLDTLKISDGRSRISRN